MGSIHRKYLLYRETTRIRCLTDGNYSVNMRRLVDVIGKVVVHWQGPTKKED